MWALGCVSVVLLTGGLAFSDPSTNMYSEKLARECNLEFLQRSQDWQQVRERPRGLVEQLLVLDEQARLTAKEALEHPWFSNQTHKSDFEQLYQRTIKHWRPRTAKSPTIEFLDSGGMKQSAGHQKVRESTKKSRQRHVPIEPPYKPFPRNMHLLLWPRRKADRRMSDEVLAAMEKWFPKSNRGTGEKEIETSRNIRAGAVSPPVRRVDAGDRKGQKAASRSMLQRPPTPRPRKMLSDAMMRCSISLPLDSVSSADLGAIYSDDEGTSVKVTLDSPDQVSTGNPSQGSPLTDAAQSADERAPNSSPSHDGEGRSAERSTPGPEMERRLKRRRSTASMGPRRKKRQGSVFDLAEDSDSDRAAKQTTRPVKRPKTVAESGWNLTSMYLPR